MICLDCKSLVLVGEKCPKCGKTLALFVPPPVDFDKKGELYKQTLELRAGQITPEQFDHYVCAEQHKLLQARGKVREGEEPLLEEAFDCWEAALKQAQQWLHSSSDFDLQAALNWATQADQKINLSIAENFARTREELQSRQAELRLRGYKPVDS